MPGLRRRLERQSDHGNDPADRGLARLRQAATAIEQSDQMRDRRRSAPWRRRLARAHESHSNASPLPSTAAALELPFVRDRRRSCARSRRRTTACAACRRREARRPRAPRCTAARRAIGEVVRIDEATRPSSRSTARFAVGIGMSADAVGAMFLNPCAGLERPRHQRARRADRRRGPLPRGERLGA